MWRWAALLGLAAAGLAVWLAEPDPAGPVPDQTAHAVVHSLPAQLRRPPAGQPLPVLRSSADGHRFGRFDTADAVDLDSFRRAVLRHEPEILARTAPREGLFELVRSTSDEGRRLTSRSDRYNIMLWNEPWVAQYYWLLKWAWAAYAARYNLTDRGPLFIKSWANCFRPGQWIDWHQHGNVYSGTFFVAVPQAELASNTSYLVGGRLTTLVNTNGDLVLFAGIGTPHRSSELSEAQQRDLMARQGSACRITSSFDISESPVGLGHSIPFYDPRDPEFSNDPTASRAEQHGRWLLRRQRQIEEERLEEEEDDDKSDDEHAAMQMDLAARLARGEAVDWRDG